jgi:nitrate/TMAO reductase-like tetraheme cytochrome c subunit
MENVFRNQLVSKNQCVRGNVSANSFPRNANMSQCHVFSEWQRATLARFISLKEHYLSKCFPNSMATSVT